MTAYISDFRTWGRRLGPHLKVTDIPFGSLFLSYSWGGGFKFLCDGRCLSKILCAESILYVDNLSSVSLKIRRP
jgi:hypothetical protein